MPLILDGTTGIVANNIADYAISTAKLANSAVTSAKMGYSGAVLQTLIATYDGTIILTNASGGQSSQFGFGINNRAYADIVNVSITPKFANSKLVFICHCGHTSGTGSTATNGAWGMVLVKDNTTGYQTGDYPWYSGGGSWAGASGGGAYPPDTHLTMVFDAGNTSAQTWYLKGWVYSEGNSGTTRFLRNSMTVLEVAA